VQVSTLLYVTSYVVLFLYVATYAVLYLYICKGMQIHWLAC